MSNSRKKEFLYKNRNSKTRKMLPVFLILCEWETEQYYFESIQEDVKSLSVVSIKSDKKSISKMAEESIKYKSMKKYDKVFCVFDRNNSDQRDYDSWVKKMKNNQINPIFSNQAFEVRILLHFENFDKSIWNPNEYIKFVRKHIPLYEKWYKDLHGNRLDLYLKTKNNIDEAIKRAENIKLINEWHPMSIEPYTDVQEIIKKLKDFMI